MASEDTVSASDWVKGIALSVLASIIGASSKLAIRKSWLLQQQQRAMHSDDDASRPPFPNAVPVPYAEQSAYQALARPGSVAESLHSHGSESSPVPPMESFTNEPQLAAPSPNRRVRIMAWCLRGSGMLGMSVFNPACCVWAMNYASPSILAPFSGLTLVWIIFFSQPLIGEQPTCTQIVAACLIMCGEVLVAVFGDHLNAPDMTIEKVAQSYQELPFLLYIIGTLLWMGLILWLIRYGRSPKARRFAWGVAGGSITGFQNFLKDALTLVQVRQPHERLPAYTWLFAALAALTAFGGLLFLTWCMKRYDATYSAAMFVGSFVVNASIMAAVHYHTFQHLQGITNFIMYPVGLLVLMCGVWILVNEKGAALPQEALNEADVDVPSNEHGHRGVNASSHSVSSGAARVELEPLVVATRGHDHNR